MNEKWRKYPPASKPLAKELKVPVIVLAQLNRGPESRTGASLGVPRISDLRESGSIEQDADMIGLLYRSAYYAEDEEKRQQMAGRANLHLAKNRNGPTGGRSAPLRSGTHALLHPRSG